jgi:hypothetical protein
MNKLFFEFILVEISIPTYIVCLWVLLSEESNKSKKFTEIEKIAKFVVPRKSLKKTIEMNKCLFESIYCRKFYMAIPAHIVCLWIQLGEESNKSNFFIEIVFIA